MATVIQKPPDFGGIPLGRAVGAAAGKGLSSFLQAKMDRERKQALLKGLSDLEDAVSSAASIEEAQKIDPFRFIDATMVSDAQDVAAITQFRDARIKALFPEKVPLVSEQGQLIGEIGKGRSRRVAEGIGLLPSEFKDIQVGRGARRGKGKGKFTLSDQKLDILLRMSRNEAQGLPREHGLQPTEVETVAALLKDPDQGQAIKIALESREFFRLKTTVDRARFVQGLMDVIKQLRKGKDPTPSQRRLLGDKTVEDAIDLSVRQPALNVQRGFIGEAPPDIPADLRAAGVTENDVIANLNFLRAKNAQVTREQVIKAMQAKLAKERRGGRR